MTDNFWQQFKHNLPLSNQMFSSQDWSFTANYSLPYWTYWVEYDTDPELAIVKEGQAPWWFSAMIWV